MKSEQPIFLILGIQNQSKIQCTHVDTHFYRLVYLYLQYYECGCLYTYSVCPHDLLLENKSLVTYISFQPTCTLISPVLIMNVDACASIQCVHMIYYWRINHRGPTYIISTNLYTYISSIMNVGVCTSIQCISMIYYWRINHQ